MKILDISPFKLKTNKEILKEELEFISKLYYEFNNKKIEDIEKKYKIKFVKILNVNINLSILFKNLKIKYICDRLYIIKYNNKNIPIIIKTTSLN